MFLVVADSLPSACSFHWLSCWLMVMVTVLCRDGTLVALFSRCCWQLLVFLFLLFGVVVSNLVVVGDIFYHCCFRQLLLLLPSPYLLSLSTIIMFIFVVDCCCCFVFFVVANYFFLICSHLRIRRRSLLFLSALFVVIVDFCVLCWLYFFFIFLFSLSLLLVLALLFVISVVVVLFCRWYCCWCRCCFVDVCYLLVLSLFIDGSPLSLAATSVIVLVFDDCLFVAVFVSLTSSFRKNFIRSKYWWAL